MSAWSQLEQLLTCAICLDRFKNPKMLPCQHTFCGEPCMEGLVDYARRQIKCPECRAEHRIPYQGIQTFPTNVTLMRFLELHQSITGEEPEPVPSMMERCGICTEKSMVEKCYHCEKKVCTECKEAHLEILKREIARINSQVRRALNRLQDTLSQTDRNSERLLKNQTQVKDEIEEIVKRFIKDIKDKENKMLQELENYSSNELNNLTKIKEGLEVEIDNITSNCDLVEKHVVDQSDNWTDIELVEYKEIFTKTLEFLRNFDCDTADFSKKIKFTSNTDLDALRRSVCNFGELKFLQPETDSFNPCSTSMSHQSLNTLTVPPQNALMRSQSDHRLAAQFARREARLADLSSRIGGGYSDTERERGDRSTSPLSYNRNRRESLGIGSDRRDFGEERSRNRFGRDADSTRSWSRIGEEDTYSGPHFRSRFMREKGGDFTIDEHDSDYTSSHRSVRFEEPAQPIPKSFDTQGATRGPLSGVVKLSDCAHFLERLHENEAKQKVENSRKEEESRNLPSAPVTTTPTPVLRRVPSRQVSEDEIEKQKKANKAEAASASAATPVSQNPNQSSTTVPASPQSKTPSVSSSVSDSPTSRYVPRRVATLREEEDSRSGSGRRGSSDSTLRQDSDTSTFDDAQNDDEDSYTSRLARRRMNSSEEMQSSPRQVAMDDILLEEEVKKESTPPPNPPTTQSSWRSNRSSTCSLPARMPSYEIEAPENNYRGFRNERSPCNSRSSEYRNDKSFNYSNSKVRSPSFERETTKSYSRHSISRENSSRSALEFTGQERPNYSRYRSTGISNRLARSTTVSSLGPISPRLSEERSVRSRPVSPTTSVSPVASYHYNVPSFGLTDSSFIFRAVHPSMAKSLSLTDREIVDRRPSPGADQEPRQTSFYNRMKRNSIVEECDRKVDGEECDENSESEFESEEHEESDTEAEEDKHAFETARTTTGSFCSSRFKPLNSSTNCGSVRKKHVELPTSVADLLTRSAKVRRDSIEIASRRSSLEPVASRYKPFRESSGYSSTGKSSRKQLTDFSSARNKSKLRSTTETETANRFMPRKVAAYKTNRTNLLDDCLQEDTKRSFARRDYLPTNSTLGTQSTFSGNIYRSKSSHVLGGIDASDDEEETPSYRNKPPPETNTYTKSRYQYRTREPANQRGDIRDSSPAEEASSGSNAWSQYLRNKYASSKTSSLSGSSGSAGKSHLAKSKSSHAVYSRLGSDSSDEDEPVSTYRRASRADLEDTSSRRSNTGYSFTLPRTMYLQKRRMIIKIGKRGTDPGYFTWPRGVAVGPDNSIVVADSSNHRVQVFDSTGRFNFEFGSYGTGEGEFDCLAGICVNRIGQFIVSDRYNHRIQVFDPSGRFMRAFGVEGRADGKFNYPWGVTSDSLGFIYVCDKENHRIQVFQSDGTFVGKFGFIGSRAGQLEHPHYIAVTNTNRVVVSDCNNHRVQIFDVNGRSLSTFGSEGSEEGQFKFPRGIAVDDQGYIIVGDSGNNRIQVFNPDGTFLKSFGSWGSGDGEFKGLEGVAVTSTGNILVCDRENHRIQVF